MHARTHTCTHTHTQMHTRTHACTHTCTHMHTHSHTNTHTHIYQSIHPSVTTHWYMCVHCGAQERNICMSAIIRMCCHKHACAVNMYERLLSYWLSWNIHTQLLATHRLPPAAWGLLTVTTLLVLYKLSESIKYTLQKSRWACRYIALRFGANSNKQLSPNNKV